MLNNQNMKKIRTDYISILASQDLYSVPISFYRVIILLLGHPLFINKCPSTEHFVYKHEICTNSARGQLIPTLLMFRFNNESIIIEFIKFHSLPLLESLVNYSGQRWKCDDSSMTSQLRHRPVTSLRMRTTVTLQETWNVLLASSSERVFIVI